MEATIKDRLFAFVDYLGIKKKDFEQNCGMSNGYLNNIYKGLGDEKLRNILTTYPQLNREWLLYGEGEMIKASRELEALTQKDETHTIRYWVDVSATGGNVQFLENPNENNVRWISVPNFSECTDAVNLYGDSMSPVYKNGEVIILKEWTENYIEYGNVYLVVTNNGNRTVKYLQPGSDDAHVRCVSANPHYAPFEIELSAIKRIYIVKGRIAKDVM